MNLRNICYALFALVALMGCNSGEPKNNGKDTTTQVTDDKEQKTFYLIPTPEDMFKFTNDKKLTFTAKVMNPIENTDKYIDTRAKELNFGIYSADLAYAAAFKKYQEAVSYLKVVRSLSDEIGISSVFNESLVKRIETIIDNKDSLIRVSSDSYYEIVKFLDKGKRNRSLALIATGGWIETLYIVSHLTEKYSEKDQTIQNIADQKVIFNNLLLYLEQYQDDAAIKTTINDLAGIKEIFDKMENVKVEQPDKSKNPNAIVIGGNTRISMTADQFKKLKEEIAKVRNTITGNNDKK